MQNIVANLTPASGRQDHTTSPSASAPLVSTSPKRPPHPAPNVRDDRDTPLLRGRDARDVAGDLGLGSRTPNAADWHDGQRWKRWSFPPLPKAPIRRMLKTAKAAE